MRVRGHLIAILLAPFMLVAQEELSVRVVEKAFAAFDYRSTIRLADSLLTGGRSLTRQEVIEAMRMKGMAWYALADEDSARSPKTLSVATCRVSRR